MVAVILNEQQLEAFSSYATECCGNVATMRIYVSEQAKRAVVIKEDDLLTRKVIEQHTGEVADATHKEISKWLDHKCFETHRLKDAKNLMTSRYVVKWKWIKDPKTESWKRIIRMRLVLRGFMDTEAFSLDTY